jgi:hypothetical protein
MEYFTLWCQVLLATVFAVAVRGKASRGAFRDFVGSTGDLLPAGIRFIRRTVALCVVVAESASVVLVLVPDTKVLGFALVAGLSASFGVGIGRALRRGVRSPCPCFGDAYRPLGRTHLIRNGILFGFAAAGLASARIFHSQGFLLPGAVVAVAAGLLAAVLLVRLEDLVGLFEPDSATNQGSRV